MATELTQPLAAAPTEGRRRRGASADRAPTRPTFSELVYAHFDWWHGLRKDALDPRATAAYHDMLAAFERRHGEIVSAYWCSNVESAVALTHKKRQAVWWARPVSDLPP